MERGFYHPGRGYWQTNSEPTQEILASYPEGTIEVPLKPDADHDWQDGEWVYVPPTVPAPTVDDYRVAIQNMIDAAARSRRYDSGTTIATYVNSSNPAWSNEAQAFVVWRDAVWTYAYVELDKVMLGERDQPTVADFLAELPAMEWPDEGLR